MSRAPPGAHPPTTRDWASASPMRPLSQRNSRERSPNATSPTGPGHLDRRGLLAVPALAPRVCSLAGTFHLEPSRGSSCPRRKPDSPQPAKPAGSAFSIHFLHLSSSAVRAGGQTMSSAHSGCSGRWPGPVQMLPHHPGDPCSELGTGTGRPSATPCCPPADEGRSSHTRLVSGVRRLQSPSECTEETEGGRSPDARPGAGDLAFRLLGLPETLAFPPPPAEGHTGRGHIGLCGRALTWRGEGGRGGGLRGVGEALATCLPGPPRRREQRPGPAGKPRSTRWADPEPSLILEVGFY